MSTVIIGSGLSGLITAVNIKIQSSSEEVIVIDQHFGPSNSMIAGQRIRAGIAGRRTDAIGEMLELFKSRNDGLVTEHMISFSEMLIKELGYWQQSGVPNSDDRLWFGPQWGDPNLQGIAKSKSVIDWFVNLAISNGVRFMTGQVTSLNLEQGRVKSVTVKNKNGLHNAFSDNFILANGTSTGLLFNSTNRPFEMSAQLLAYKADLELFDSTLTMIHPFGKCGNDNQPVSGCYETDLLTDIEITNPKSQKLDWILSLLKDHKAHYHFPKICEEIWRLGGVLELKNSKGKMFKTCVSIHYNQLSVKTEDGVTVSGVANLFAVGDASGVGFFSNHRVRFPGFALANCLVTGRLAASKVMLSNSKNIFVPQNGKLITTLPNVKKLRKEMRDINTKHLCEINLSGTKSPNDCKEWIKKLESLKNDRFIETNEIDLINLSIKIAKAHQRQLALSHSEPIIII